ncbi:MAG: oligosaccharyl transferase, archaeosortase A system-associated [Dehalococcoidia bacterium]
MIGLALALFFAVSLALRVWLPYETVFGGDWVRFGGVDPWYHIRLLENLVHHFPHRIVFDPYTFYPQGAPVFFGSFYSQMMGFTSWVLGAGSPSQNLMHTVAAYFPAILGALVIVPVYFIGRAVFNWRVGLIAAALAAVLPGEFLYRTLLGFTDHHAPEVLFTAVAMLFLILALRSANQREVSFRHLMRRDWRELMQPLIYALLVGIALGLYLLSWIGGLLFVFLIFLYAVIQYVIDHVRGQSTDYLCIIGVPSFLVALILILPSLNVGSITGLHVASLVIGILGFLALSVVSRLMAFKGMRRAYYPAAMAALGGLGLVIFYLVDAFLFRFMLWRFSYVFVPKGGAALIAEMRPLFVGDGGFSLSPVWDEYGMAFFLALMALGLLIYAITREWRAEKVLLATWSLVTLVAAVAQLRFSQYFAVNVALLTGYVSWEMLRWLNSRVSSWWPRGERRRLEERKLVGRRRKKRKTGRREALMAYASRHPELRRAILGTAVAALFFLVFYPSVLLAIALPKDLWGIDDDWHSSLLWLRDNTPEPFGDADFYYATYERPPPGQDYDYPASAYGVMSWVDYGHWITAIAHRIPNSNPFQQGIGPARSFFIAQEESLASRRLDRAGAKYVIIDWEMVLDKFGALAVGAGKDPNQFREVYYQRDQGDELQPLLLFYPEYYRSMVVRLYNFGGQTIIPDDSTWVISYTEHEDGSKEITSAQRFATYEEAEDYVESQRSPSYRIVGIDPFTSPVPLEELERYQLVYQSPSTVLQSGEERVSYVEIFEYVAP